MAGGRGRDVAEHVHGKPQEGQEPQDDRHQSAAGELDHQALEEAEAQQLPEGAVLSGHPRSADRPVERCRCLPAGERASATADQRVHDHLEATRPGTALQNTRGEGRRIHPIHGVGVQEQPLPQSHPRRRGDPHGILPVVPAGGPGGVEGLLRRGGPPGASLRRSNTRRRTPCSEQRLHDQDEGRPVPALQRQVGPRELPRRHRFPVDEGQGHRPARAQPAQPAPGRAAHPGRRHGAGDRHGAPQADHQRPAVGGPEPRQGAGHRQAGAREEHDPHVRHRAPPPPERPAQGVEPALRGGVLCPGRPREGAQAAADSAVRPRQGAVARQGPAGLPQLRGDAHLEGDAPSPWRRRRGNPGQVPEG
mmetsp:Transcript_49093/g.127382  ORF Transcript_49093/g.127382 Transcript_49093/m.127382 type:complete len:363 (-) Transcript_49093:303-1391(-)